MNRSYLFVPADSERKLAKAATAGADALILDLEDAVAPDRKGVAREMAADFLQNAEDPGPELWVRINPVDSDDATRDLAAVMAAAPAGIVLPKPRSVDDVLQLATLLDTAEQRHGHSAEQTLTMALCTERPEALFKLHNYGQATPRLSALSWGAEDLSSALGASSNRDARGNWLPVYEMARSFCLLAAATAGVGAVDTVYTDFRNLEGLREYAANARRDGFAGMLAIHPAQVEVINHAFEPTSAEVERASKIVAAFAENPGAGTLGLDGEMIDRPHLLQARRLLALADTIETRQADQK
jgi:citrate lyase subunit beta/citryl-CoA lyase